MPGGAPKRKPRSAPGRNLPRYSFASHGLPSNTRLNGVCVARRNCQRRTPPAKACAHGWSAPAPSFYLCRRNLPARWPSPHTCKNLTVTDWPEITQVARVAGAERMDLRYSEGGEAFHSGVRVFLWHLAWASWVPQSDFRAAVSPIPL